jgi:hypothetical protein
MVDGLLFLLLERDLHYGLMLLLPLAVEQIK